MVEPTRRAVILLVLGAVAAAALCPECGAETIGDETFCPSCGALLAGRGELLAARASLVAVGSDADYTVRLPDHSPGLTLIETPRYRGAGFVIDDAGSVLTTSRVVEGGEEFWVRLADGTERQAELAGVDTATGIALLRIDDPPLHVELRPPDPATALGAGDAVTALTLTPRGLLTAAPGVISTDSRQRSGLLLIERSLLFDADVEARYDGGLLVDEAGTVLGMITIRPGAMLERGRALAVPVELLVEVAAELADNGRYERSWLGLALLEPPGEAPVVWFTIPDSPAAAAGIGRGERLTALDGEPVTGLDQARGLLAARGVGAAVTLTLEDESGPREVALTVGTLPEDPRPAPRDALQFQLGLHVEPTAAGLLVTAVRPGSPADIEKTPVGETPYYRGIPGAAFENEGYLELDGEESLRELVENSYLERHFALGIFWGPTRRDGKVLISPLKAPPLL